ncbi:hypothetical protein CupriaWKF_13005 [Cupriavidus sp. WKF15]|uniref:hypothetical protein n=1 Tax=Cupriavidus sp. WKF15 TaxID=3032282 RepID=UPI0023E1A662|nr:hypothetical protein [Cupriavidus sp. WKF15]WER45217.1 hypothetical protein CupriaWKF_13005 [Cupriavidus sp. WKF15]
MKSASILAATLILLAGDCIAAPAYESHDAFYADQAGAVFHDPIRSDAGIAYAYPDKPGIYIQLRSELEGKPVNIEVAGNRVIVNGRVYRFSRATTFPGEHALDIVPTSALVFLAQRTDYRPPLLCVEGHSNRSGEAGRHTQIYLLIDPIRQNGKATFLHLPSLLSACRAVVSTRSGGISFPKNSYLFDDAREARVGLQLDYYSFERGRFTPTGTVIHLKFSQPDNPFAFSPQEGR